MRWIATTVFLRLLNDDQKYNRHSPCNDLQDQARTDINPL